MRPPYSQEDVELRESDQGEKGAGLLQDPRGGEGRQSGPDKERVPEAGDEAPPRQEPGQRGGVGQVQGGLHSLRRSLRPQQGRGHLSYVFRGFCVILKHLFDNFRWMK